MAQGQKQYLVKWEIDITADSVREAAKQALEIQQDKTSEALAFDVYEKATNSETAVNLLAERTEGSDICYRCGTAQEYRTMADLDEADFAIFCAKCHPVAKAVKELEEIVGMLETNSMVDWHVQHANIEFKAMADKVNKIVKDLVSTKYNQIDYIRKVISKYGRFTTAEAQADCSPAINVLGDMSILIEEFGLNQCIAFTYVHSTCTCETNMDYEELEPEVIEQIFNLVKSWEEIQKETNLN